jgi:hypothetical protein
MLIIEIFSIPFLLLIAWNDLMYFRTNVACFKAIYFPVLYHLFGNCNHINFPIHILDDHANLLLPMFFQRVSKFFWILLIWLLFIVVLSVNSPNSSTTSCSNPSFNIFSCMVGTIQTSWFFCFEPASFNSGVAIEGGK